MNISFEPFPYHFLPTIQTEDQILPEEIDEIKAKVPQLEKPFEQKLGKFLEFLDQQQKEGIYIEIHYPIAYLGITVLLSKLKEKFLISVLDHANSKVYGNLIVEGFECVGINDLKEFGQWSTYSEYKLSIFKPLE